MCASSAERYERNWSVYGKIKTAESSRMGHEVADKRVYCHEALHLKEKLQSAGYKQEAVGWDTDDASDASATEADLAVNVMCQESARLFVRRPSLYVLTS